MDMKKSRRQVKARGDLGRKFSRNLLLSWALWVISDLNMPDFLLKKKLLLVFISSSCENRQIRQWAFSKKIKGHF